MHGRVFVSSLCALACLVLPTRGEDIVRVDFSAAPAGPLFHNTWGDRPAEVLVNGAVPNRGRAGAAGCLKLRFGPEVTHKLSYWSLALPFPVPIIKGVSGLSFQVRANVPVSLKIPITPFGFVYHGPSIGRSADWQQVTLDDTYEKLMAWCAGGKKDGRDGTVAEIIVAVATSPDTTAEVDVDDLVITGAEGTAAKIAAESRQRRFKRVRASVVTLPWSDEGRSLAIVLDRLDEAGEGAGADIVCLPMECIKSDGEPIPGPSSRAIAAKAKQHRMYVIGNLRERDGNQVYVTSFLCSREGEIVGKYRKSHKMPDEEMTLGDDLPVFDTDFGVIAMRIGSDRYFPEIDHTYTVKGARMLFWSQMPEPVEDEHLQDYPSAGRASEYDVFIACARYARAEDGWLTNFFPPYRGSPIGRSYVIDREGQRIACTPRKGSVATASIPYSELQRAPRGVIRSPAFRALAEPVPVPARKEWKKRVVRVTAIENHVGIQDMLAKLDQAGQLGSDIVCTYEFVWGPVHGAAPTPQKIAQLEAAATANRARVAAKAKQWRMYVLLCGVVATREVNEGILYGRDGEEVGRYRKIARTYPEQILGTETTPLETDFGRIGVRICADEGLLEIDRCYAIKGADIVFFSTQDWGAGDVRRHLRDTTRAMDGQYFHVQATHASSETLHRSLVIDPTGMPVAASRYKAPGIVSAVIDLDNDRPRRYVRKFTAHAPRGYLPQYQPTEFPETQNDLKDTVLRQRRPELYAVLAVTKLAAEQPAKATASPDADKPAR